MSKILVTGATGLIGFELIQKLFMGEHSLVIVGRDLKKLEGAFPIPCQFFEWDFSSEFPVQALNDVEHVVHLAGESIADERWTDERKQKILQSRVKPTQLLLEGIAKAKNSKVQSVVCSSAIGYYGDAGDSICDEAHPHGTGFLAETTVAWENALFQSAPNLQVRRVAVRTGIVLSLRGGALVKMLPLIRVGLGGKLGNGKQWMSWIHINDMVGLIEKCIFDKSIIGPINAVAPEPIQNNAFVKAIAAVLKRPTLFPAPRIALNIALGEMSAVVLESQRVSAEKAKSHGFQFEYNKLQDALGHLMRDGAQHVFKTMTWIPAPVPKVFSFFSKAENLERITPPWLNFRIVSASSEVMQANTTITYKLKIKGAPTKWVTRISLWNAPFEFVDEQEKGPYVKWHHTHSFKAIKDGTLMVDTVRYTLPFGTLGDIIAGSMVHRDVNKIFKFRSEVIQELTF